MDGGGGSGAAASDGGGGKADAAVASTGGADIRWKSLRTYAGAGTPFMLGEGPSVIWWRQRGTQIGDFELAIVAPDGEPEVISVERARNSSLARNRAKRPAWTEEEFTPSTAAATFGRVRYYDGKVARDICEYAIPSIPSDNCVSLASGPVGADQLVMFQGPGGGSSASLSWSLYDSVTGQYSFKATLGSALFEPQVGVGCGSRIVYLGHASPAAALACDLYVLDPGKAAPRQLTTGGKFYCSSLSTTLTGCDQTAIALRTNATGSDALYVIDLDAPAAAPSPVGSDNTAKNIEVRDGFAFWVEASTGKLQRMKISTRTQDTITTHAQGGQTWGSGLAGAVIWYGYYAEGGAAEAEHWNLSDGTKTRNIELPALPAEGLSSLKANGPLLFDGHRHVWWLSPNPDGGTPNLVHGELEL